MFPGGKMKKGQKLVKALAIFTMSAAAVSCAVAVGCKKHTHTFSDEWKSDDSGHWYSATCGHDEKKDYAPHVYDNDADDDCNECGYVRHDFESKWLFDYNNHYHACKYDGCDEHGSVGAHKFSTDNKCTDCGAKFATYEFIPDKLEATTYAEGHVNGIFTVLPGTTVRLRSRLNYSVYDWNNGEGDSTSAPVVTDFNATKSVQYNGADRGISVKAIAPGKLTIYVDNGSGGKTKKDRQTILLTKPDGNTQVISYYCGDIYAITIDCETAGVYKISRGNQPGVGTTDLYYAKFETVVEETPVENIQIVNKGKDRYVKGETFDASKLQLEIVRETTGITEPLDLNAEGLVIDSSAFNANAAGTYTIKVSYTVDGKTFKDEYTVVVYDVEAIELGFNKIIHAGNTSAGNGQYVNVTVKQFYFKDEALNLDGLTVKTVLDEGKQKVIVTEGYEVTGFVAGQAGKQTVKVAWTDNPEIFATFDVYVANYTAASIATNKDITVNVNAALADEKVGVLENGAYQFKTIQQSLDFLNALNLEQNVKKTINLSEGLYKERIEINIPNLTIKGADNAHPEKTVIEWDSLVGIADESGFVHITDSTATLNVREKAVGFVIEGVTISNWYNSTEHFDEAFGPGYAEHRALAALIQADKVVIDNCRLLGYQDTIELFTGRQLIQNTYICGRTDFIFGTNNTTYFKDCTIESIVDGGYVTAFKGNNKGDNDWVQYGAIFDGCNFIAPEAVIAKKDTSLGRTWGKYAAVAYVNCDFAGHISTTPYSSAKGTRYTAMSGAEPTDPTVKFVEYNNTGDGAVNQSIAGMTYLTAEQAANYSDMSVFFGEVNGKVVYSDSWDGGKGVEISTVDYRFSEYYTATDGMTYHDIPEGGEEILGGLATITGTKWGHELDQGKDQAKFDKDCVIQFKTAGKVIIKTYGAPYGAPENVKINYLNGIATVTIVATEAQPIQNGCYITLIQVDGKDIPAHVHEYGDWTVETVPTSSAIGAALKTCKNCESDPAHSEQIELPVLSETDYAISAGTSAGNSKYTYTTDGGETIEFEAPTLAGMHVHDYGNTWTITATAESAGKAIKTCTAEGECNAPTIEVEIPALNDSRYTITNNTATLEAAGTGTYSIEIDGETISFTAATPMHVLETVSTPKSFAAKDIQENSTKQIYLEKAVFHGGKYWKLGADSKIVIKVAAGAKLTFVCDYWGDGIEVSGCNGTLTEDGSDRVYTAVDAGDVVITRNSAGTNVAYILSISISYGLSTIESDMTFSSANGIDNTEYIEFTGVQSHSGGQYWNLGKTGTIKLKVAAGATITVTCNFWGNGIAINGEQQDTTGGSFTYTSATEGEIVIGCLDGASNVSYIQTIAISGLN